MLNILTYCPGPKDPTSFYRGLGPLLEMQREYHDINIIEGDLMRTSWNHIAKADIVFLQRPHQPAYRQVAEIATQMGRPLWVDLDDDHLNVPLHYDISRLYNDMDNRKAHIDIVKMADVITVSTEQLALNYRSLNPNVEVIPNALPNWLYQLPLDRSEHTRPRILWRGSEKHSYDLALYLPQLNEIIKHDVEMIFFGYRPEVTDAPNVSFIEHTMVGDMLGYFKKLSEIEPDLVIVPLEFNDFNKCKSNNAMIEAYWAGADVLAPAMQEWEGSTVNYSTMENFIVGFSSWVNWKFKSKQVVAHTLKLSDTNEQRLEITNRLRVGDFKPVNV